MKNIVTDYGAVPGQDCTAAFQAAAKVGGAIAVPAGTYYVSGNADACVVIPNSCRFIGETWATTQILYKAPAGVDGFTFRPDPNIIADGSGFERICIKSAATSGGYPVRIDLSQPGALLRGARFPGVYFIAPGGVDAALKLDNPANLNGFFCSTITESMFWGGLKLLGCGDSVSILDCTLTGPNPGVYATFEPGAARLKVGRCNITSDGGAVVLFGADQASIENCQCEQENPYSGDFNGMFILSGCIDCEIQSCNINNHGYTACVVLENGTNCTIVARNTLMTGGSQAHVLIGPNSPTNALSASNRYRGAPGGDGIAVNSVDGTSPLWNLT